ncbi:hypothetical protein QR680_006108 [Steinernema hermaphroditum]|uniref:BZIP domain-containing protein n=1 Tax=Steinernema hermaphroditum TaxID=289476 RepID=A0AA39HVP1_9BILA|nr:hypothetical protein QR680_006108 [Steinernema hermaphroditum]
MLCEKAFDLTSVPVEQRLLDLQAAKGGRKRSIGPLTPNAERQRRFRERRNQELSILSDENDELRNKVGSLTLEVSQLRCQLKTVCEKFQGNSPQTLKRKRSKKIYALKMPFNMHQLRKREKIRMEKKIDTIKAEIENMRMQNLELLDQLKEIAGKEIKHLQVPPQLNANLLMSSMASLFPTLNIAGPSLPSFSGVIVNPPVTS